MIPQRYMVPQMDQIVNFACSDCVSMDRRIKQLEESIARLLYEATHARKMLEHYQSETVRIAALKPPAPIVINCCKPGEHHHDSPDQAQ